VQARAQVRVRAIADSGDEKVFQALIRIDSPLETEQYHHGGILPYIMRRLLAAAVG
jgi:aconitate hydratase